MIPSEPLEQLFESPTSNVTSGFIKNHTQPIRLQEFKNNSNNMILSVNIPDEIIGENSLPMRRFNKSMKNHDRIASYARKIASINQSTRASRVVSQQKVASVN